MRVSPGRTFAFWILIGGSLPVACLAWELRPGVTVRTTYSDNVGLAPEGLEESDFVVDVTPRISIRRTGSSTDAEAETRGEVTQGGISKGTQGRIKLNFDYGFQSLGNSGGTSRDVSHQLQGEMLAELVKQRVFVDARSTIGQQAVSNRRIAADDIASETGNQTEVITYVISPFVLHHLGNYADGEVRFTHDGVINRDVSSADSTSTEISGRLTSGSRFSRFPWAVVASHREIENESRSTTKLANLTGQVSYVFSRKWSVTQLLGVDKNDFATSQSDSDGLRWRTSLEWSPNQRMTVSAGYGEQFSGGSFSFEAEYRHRRLVFRASRSEETSTVRRDQLNRVIVPLVDAFGDTVQDPFSGQPVRLALDLPTLTDDVFVESRTTASGAWRGRTANLSLNTYATTREFQLSNSDETVYGATVRWGRSLGRNLRVSLDGNWQQSEFDDFGQTDTRFDAGASVTHRLGRSFSTSATYRYTEQTSDLAANEFSENRVTVAVNLNF